MPQNSPEHNTKSHFHSGSSFPPPPLSWFNKRNIDNVDPYNIFSVKMEEPEHLENGNYKYYESTQNT